MKGTRDGIKNRQLQKDGYLQMVSAEQRENAEVFAHQRIPENNANIITLQTNNLLEEILHRNNLNKAFKRVKSNKGAGGIDGMSVDELLPYLKDNQEQLVQQIKDGKYKPNPVRRVEIPKEGKGEKRKPGVPTVVDRVFQQSIAQVLSPIYEEQFSENSFGFRPRRNQHQALKQCQQNANDGYTYVVDMDLEKFFDTVCQSKLIEVLAKTIRDGRVISLIHKYLNAGVVSRGLFEKTEVGMPQGGPLSPLLSNIMLNELDKELTKRGHRFIRFADDCLIFCKSKKSAQRTMENIIPFIEGRLFLKVNREKTTVANIKSVKYLSYGFYQINGEYRFRVHPKSVAKMKQKLRQKMNRSNGWGNEHRKQKLIEFVRGWINYFKLADMKKLMQQTDEWLRRKIRAVYWKQWKKVKTRYKMLKKYNLPEWKVHEVANCRKGIWRSALVLNSILTNKEIANLGYISMADYYIAK